MMVFRGSYMDLLGEISKNEGIEETVLRRRIESGRIVVPYNPVHSPRPCGVGEGLSVKINVNVGTSRDRVEVSEELEKVDIALRYGADAIMDRARGGYRCYPPYHHQGLTHAGGNGAHLSDRLRMARKSAVVDMDEDDMFNGFVQHARDGVDFMTVHCGITARWWSVLSAPRMTDVVSRGAPSGRLMIHNGKENPFYQISTTCWSLPKSTRSPCPSGTE